MAWKTYSCTKCTTNVVLDIPMTAPKEEQQTQTIGCPTCQRRRKFERVWVPTAFSFGMMTRRYSGQNAAVTGWGTHGLDYGNGKSDLVAGRAQEAAQRIDPAVVE